MQPAEYSLALVNSYVEVIDIGEKHTVTYLLPDCALAVDLHSSMSACDSMQAAITLTCMARNSLTL